ncbi:hypothetical protein PV326_003243 [Microctonus aethiopoides]|nr:hypothetical protein PV326_003243 [Microctonus aethiopoides]
MDDGRWASPSQLVYEDETNRRSGSVVKSPVGRKGAIAGYMEREISGTKCAARNIKRRLWLLEKNQLHCNKIFVKVYSKFVSTVFNDDFVPIFNTRIWVGAEK